MFETGLSRRAHRPTIVRPWREEIFSCRVMLYRSGFLTPLPVDGDRLMKISSLSSHAMVVAALCTLLFVGSFSAPCLADEAPPEVSFRWAGEELYYSIRVNGAEAMRAGLRTGALRQSNGRTYIALNGMARSQGFFHAVYPLDDRVHTFLDPHAYRPLRSEKIFLEAGKSRTYNVDYQHSRFEAQVERAQETRTTRFRSPIPGTTHDMLTWVYDLRRKEHFSIGEKFSFYIYDGWLLSRLDLEIVGREDLLTPMGWFKTWKVAFSRGIMEVTVPLPESEDAPPIPPRVVLQESARHSGHIWFSRDENLLPVRVAINTTFGEGEAVLIRYQPGTGR